MTSSPPRKKARPRKPKCVEPIPTDFTSYRNLVDFNDTKAVFKNFRKWVNPHSKSERLKAAVCKKPKGPLCASHFGERRTIENLRQKQHHSLHSSESRPYDVVTLFVTMKKTDALMEDGSKQHMMMLVGERKRATMRKYLASKATSNDEESQQNDDEEEKAMEEDDNLVVLNMDMQPTPDPLAEIEKKMNEKFEALKEQFLSLRNERQSETVAAQNRNKSAPKLQQTLDFFTVKHKGKQREQQEQVAARPTITEPPDPRFTVQFLWQITHQYLLSDTLDMLINDELFARSIWFDRVDDDDTHEIQYLFACRACYKYYKCPGERATNRYTLCCKSHAMTVNLSDISDPLKLIEFASKFKVHCQQNYHKQEAARFEEYDVINRKETFQQVLHCLDLIRENAPDSSFESDQVIRAEIDGGNNKNNSLKRVKDVEALLFDAVAANHAMKVKQPSFRPMHASLSLISVHADTYSKSARKGEIVNITKRSNSETVGSFICWKEWKYTAAMPVIQDKQKVKLIVLGLSEMQTLPTCLETADIHDPTARLVIITKIGGDSKYKQAVQLFNENMSDLYTETNDDRFKGRIYETLSGPAYLDQCHVVNNQFNLTLKQHKEEKQAQSVLKLSTKLFGWPKASKLWKSLSRGDKKPRISPAERYLTHLLGLMLPYVISYRKVVRVLRICEWKQLAAMKCADTVYHAMTQVDIIQSVGPEMLVLQRAQFYRGAEWLCYMQMFEKLTGVESDRHKLAEISNLYRNTKNLNVLRLNIEKLQKFPTLTNRFCTIIETGRYQNVALTFKRTIGEIKAAECKYDEDANGIDEEDANDAHSKLSAFLSRFAAEQQEQNESDTEDDDDEIDEMMDESSEDEEDEVILLYLSRIAVPGIKRRRRAIEDSESDSNEEDEQDVEQQANGQNDDEIEIPDTMHRATTQQHYRACKGLLSLFEKYDILCLFTRKLFGRNNKKYEAMSRSDEAKLASFYLPRWVNEIGIVDSFDELRNHGNVEYLALYESEQAANTEHTVITELFFSLNGEDFTASFMSFKQWIWNFCTTTVAGRLQRAEFAEIYHDGNDQASTLKYYKISSNVPRCR